MLITQRHMQMPTRSSCLLACTATKAPHKGARAQDHDAVLHGIPAFQQRQQPLVDLCHGVQGPSPQASTYDRRMAMTIRHVVS